MKRLAAILVLIMTVFAGYSQTGSADKKKDTTCVCVTPSEMRNAIRTDDSLRIAMEELAAKELVIRQALLNISQRDSLIKKQESLHAANLKIISNLESQTINMDRSNKLALDYNSYLKLQVRQAKKKTRTIAGLSVTVIGALTYLLIKK
jgi:hypothetical protein